MHISRMWVTTFTTTQFTMFSSTTKMEERFELLTPHALLLGGLKLAQKLYIATQFSKHIALYVSSVVHP